MEVCPFSAIFYEEGVLDISSGCKMCKMCVRKSKGSVTFEEDKKEIDKSAWKGIRVYADCSLGRIPPSPSSCAARQRSWPRLPFSPVFC